MNRKLTGDEKQIIKSYARISFKKGYQYNEFDLYKNGTKLTPTTSSANIKTYEDIPRDNDSFVVKVMVDGVEMSYNITVSYSTVNDVNVDKLVEGGNK